MLLFTSDGEVGQRGDGAEGTPVLDGLREESLLAEGRAFFSLTSYTSAVTSKHKTRGIFHRFRRHFLLDVMSGAPSAPLTASQCRCTCRTQRTHIRKKDMLQNQDVQHPLSTRKYPKLKLKNQPKHHSRTLASHHKPAAGQLGSLTGAKGSKTHKLPPSLTKPRASEQRQGNRTNLTTLPSYI
ncbi:hypothetical protein E2C01_073771 [Portunus trituberculatus]|uniref:Uncharacterized protein n=1 Tax=Portunus trituberculatus TaxID=210409 RepID=A0A5B7IAL2_PORTR|nr:hypothetical protein [Portunus trituberculatus]